MSNTTTQDMDKLFGIGSTVLQAASDITNTVMDNPSRRNLNPSNNFGYYGNNQQVSPYPQQQRHINYGYGYGDGNNNFGYNPNQQMTAGYPGFTNPSYGMGV